jgi:hypothetical protein
MMNSTCKCQPATAIVNGVTLVTHYAWDGRDFYKVDDSAEPELILSADHQLVVRLSDIKG